MAARKAAATTKPASKRPPRARKAKPPATKKAAPTKRAPSRGAGGTETQKHRPTPEDLGTRGRRMWMALERLVDGERGTVLLEEACRIGDRLDKLDALLQGDADTWTRLVQDLCRETVYELRIDSALIEARQQANVLRQILTGLPLKREPTGDGDKDPAGWVDDL